MDSHEHSGSNMTEEEGLLHGVGYKVSSWEQPQTIENLNSMILHSSPLDIPELTSDITPYNNFNFNPSESEIGSWNHSLLLNNFNHSDNIIINTIADQPLNQPQQQMSEMTVASSASTEQQQQQQQEDTAIRLVHMLISCADSLQRGHVSLATSLIHAMQSLLQHVTTASAIGKVATHFVHALTRRILAPPQRHRIVVENDDVLYHHFYEACPYLKFAHFTANQAILEAFAGHRRVHVIDFDLMHGLQWPPLIQALALRPGGPPSLRLTGIGPPSLDRRDNLRETGRRLAELARSVNVRFSFRGVAAARLDEVEPWMLEVRPEEAVAVNSVMQLHRLLGSDSMSGDSGIELVLGWIRRLNPKIMTVVEQEANHNQTGFLERFTEALHYYSAVFDSLEACPVEPDRAFAEMYLQREICNVVCCEGPARVERHEPLARWRARLGKAGFKSLHLGSNALKQARMLLSLFSAEGYCVEEREGCLTLGWHGLPLIAASAWEPLPFS